MSTLKHGDLKDCVFPEISVDEYEAKIGNSDEVIVIAFYVTEEDAGKDLDDFLEKSWIDILDADVSPNPTKDGKYMVFVELTRDKDFFTKFNDVVKEVENLSGKQKWLVSTRGMGARVPYKSDEFTSHVNLQSAEPFKESTIDKARKFMANSNFLVEAVDNKLKLTYGREYMYLSVVDLDESAKVIDRNKHIPMSIERDSHEASVLKKVLGEEWDVLQLKGCISLQHINNDDILIVGV